MRCILILPTTQGTSAHATQIEMGTVFSSVSVAQCPRDLVGDGNTAEPLAGPAEPAPLGPRASPTPIGPPQPFLARIDVPPYLSTEYLGIPPLPEVPNTLRFYAFSRISNAFVCHTTANSMAELEAANPAISDPTGKTRAAFIEEFNAARTEAGVTFLYNGAIYPLGHIPAYLDVFASPCVRLTDGTQYEHVLIVIAESGYIQRALEEPPAPTAWYSSLVAAVFGGTASTPTRYERTPLFRAILLADGGRIVVLDNCLVYPTPLPTFIPDQ